jgi:hypothetical protein
VKLSALLAVLVPAGVVTVTSTVPALSGGDVAVICVALLMLNAASAAPKCTAVAPEKLMPDTVTLVPPAVGPLFGATALTLGDGPVPARAVAEAQDDEADPELLSVKMIAGDVSSAAEGGDAKLRLFVSQTFAQFLARRTSRRR